MSLVVCNGGKLIFLQGIKDLMQSEVYRLHLFQNNHIPAESDTLADYTEADFDGYENQVIPSWSPPYLNGDGKAEIDNTNQTFTQNGVGTTCDVYGYYVTNQDSSQLIFAELDPDGPVAMDAIGKTYTIFLRFTLADDV